METAQSIPVRLSYGRECEFACEVNAARVAVFRPGPPPVKDVATAVQRAMSSPLGLPTLDQALVPDDRIVIALESGTPAAELLIAEIWKWLERRDISPSETTILQPASLEATSGPDPRTLLPEPVASEITWKIHDATDEEACGYLATTSDGERVYLAREIIEADFVLPVGVTQYDPLLGYRGTHSVIFPGLSTVDAIAKTVGQGHPELSPHQPRPARQLVDEISWLLGIQFVVQILPAASGGILEVAAGGAEDVFRHCCGLLDDHWMIEMPDRVSTVVVAVPTDSSGHGWAQVGSALSTARQLVEMDGRIVILSELDQPPGDGMKLVQGCDEPLDAVQPLRATCPQDLIPATQLVNSASWARIYLLSQLHEELIDDLFMYPLAGHGEVERIIESSESCAFIGTAQNTFGLVS